MLLSREVMSESLQLHGLQHARLPRLPLSPEVCSNLSSLSRWCHPTISSSVVPFSFCPPSSPASGSLPISLLFTSGGLSIRASASASVLPMNIQHWFPFKIDWFDLVFQGLLRGFSSTTIPVDNKCSHSLWKDIFKFYSFSIIERWWYLSGQFQNRELMLILKISFSIS